ncbi:MAG TPA: translation initiation factor IF-2 [Candidatus Omnitrophota bacterium]|nr:translation initiation factor IF-2 [Candidatus Omnitrophota bacterium]
MASKKIKVSDLAKELGKTSKELLKVLAELGVSAKSAVSSIEEESAKVVRELLAPKKEAPAKPAPSAAPAPKSAVAAKPAAAKPLAPKPEAPKKESIPAAPKKEPPVVKEVAAPPPPPPPPPVPEPPKLKNIRIADDGIVLKELSDKLGAKVSDLIKELLKKGVMATINQKISFDIAKDISLPFGFEIEAIEKPPAAQKHEIFSLEVEDKSKLKVRPPVVTVMGHVDHGKTKLLDAIRSTKVAESEAGGITQHIGAYQVHAKGKKITFLDTPGHEAFTALRARGAKVTDLAVLVVAADDGVMPQTVEAADHAKAAGVPIIVAINKVDKPEANIDRVKQQLSSELGLQPEDWGGQTVTVPISAKQKTGIDELLDMILLIAEMAELKADPSAKAVGVVVESRLDKGQGPVATVLIKNGTLHVGDCYVIGGTYGKVRALISDKGERMQKAGPSTPVLVLGTSEVPRPGDLLQVVGSEPEARQLAEQLKETQVKLGQRAAQTLEDISQNIEKGEQIDLKLIIKSDVRGSLEALIKSLGELNVSGKRVEIIHHGVGNINESDILLAEASNAIVVGFNVDTETRAKELAESEGIEIRLYNIIYKLLDDVKLALAGTLKVEYEEVTIGKAEVRATFRYSKVGVIAGCFVLSGKLIRGAGLRIFRGNEKIYDGKLESLKRIKEDVKEVAEGYECGVAVIGYEDFKVGDTLECFEKREKAR